MATLEIYQRSVEVIYIVETEFFSILLEELAI